MHFFYGSKSKKTIYEKNTFIGIACYCKRLFVEYSFCFVCNKSYRRNVNSQDRIIDG